MKLVLVETPAQAKTLTGVLGEGWRVEPCYGVVRDLSADRLGVDVEDDFRPTFVVAAGKGNLVRRLLKAVRESTAVYAATSPGRTGEMMAWHVLALSPDVKDKPVYRVSLDALTPEGVRMAFATPRPLNMHWIDAELTNRIVERLVGYGVTPALKPTGMTAPVSHLGLIALRLLAEREMDIRASKPETRWTVKTRLVLGGETVGAGIYHPHGAPVSFTTRAKAEQVAAALDDAQFWIDKAGVRQQERIAPVPYGVPTLLLDAETKLDLSPERTLGLLDMLYDAGWITHPHGAPLPDAVETVRAYIRREYGTDYLPAETRDLGGIAPTDVHRTPEDLPGDGAALYGLLWRRFVAAQVSPARLRQSGARLLAGTDRDKPFPLELRVYGALVAFDGWLRVQPDEMPALGVYLPELRAGDLATCSGVTVEEHSALLPERYTPASLIAAHGGARLLTWAAALNGLIEANLVQIDGGRLLPTEAGIALSAWVETRFPSVVSESAVGELERAIEGIAAGENTRIDALRAFWERFSGDLHRADSPAEAKRPAGEHKPVILRPVEEG